MAGIAALLSPVVKRGGGHPAAVFASARPMLFSIAYRMLGSVMDAEDLVQDAYLRWQEATEAASDHQTGGWDSVLRR